MRWTKLVSLFQHITLKTTKGKEELWSVTSPRLRSSRETEPALASCSILLVICWAGERKKNHVTYTNYSLSLSFLTMSHKARTIFIVIYQQCFEWSPSSCRPCFFSISHIIHLGRIGKILCHAIYRNSLCLLVLYEGPKGKQMCRNAPTAWE